MEEQTKTTIPEDPASESEAPPAPKLKVICRLLDGRYTETIVSEDADPSAEDATRVLLHAFAAESLTRDLTEACGSGSVVVLRTDNRQMGEFRALLEAHGTFDM